MSETLVGVAWIIAASGGASFAFFAGLALLLNTRSSGR